MKYEIAEYLETRFDMQPDSSLVAAEHIVEMFERPAERMRIALVRCRKALQQRNNPEAGALIEFALESADLALHDPA